jgi:hypothetical protein
MLRRTGNRAGVLILACMVARRRERRVAGNREDRVAVRPVVIHPAAGTQDVQTLTQRLHLPVAADRADASAVQVLSHRKHVPAIGKWMTHLPVAGSVYPALYRILDICDSDAWHS